MASKETRFRAMGTHCHVLVDAAEGVADELVHLARLRVELLEQCWSRFRPGSELSRLNDRSGQGPVLVSADLLRLVTTMRAAWHVTGGLFDPTVLTAVRAAGYDADFAAVAERPASSWQDVALAAVPGMAGVVVDADASTVTLPTGVGLDPGAIGKGLAGDIIATELRGAGASGALVNLGGDLSIAGRTQEPWAIDVEDERRAADDPLRVLRTIRLPAASDRFGVATSTTLKRRWAQGRRHHVIDPRTSLPSTTATAQVTVVARSAAAADIPWTWLGIRASGITAWGLLSAVVIWGLLLRSRLLGRLAAPVRLLELHRWLGAVALAFLGVHLGLLLIDPAVHFSVTQILVPGMAPWNTAAVALDTIALWLLIPVSVVGRIRTRLGKAGNTWFRRSHLVAYAAWPFATAHYVLAGTDALAAWSLAILLAGVSLVVITLLARGFVPPPRAARRTPSTATPATDTPASLTSA